MKQRAAKKLTKQQKKANTLFSKLRGLGILGFIDRRGEETNPLMCTYYFPRGGIRGHFCKSINT